MSWSRISVFQLLSKIEEILRKENVSPQPPGSSAQRPSMLWRLPLSSAMCLRGNRPQTDRDGFDVSRFFPFLSPDNSEHHCVTQHGTAWKGTYRFSPSHTSMWQQSYPRDDRQREWEIRELTPSSEEPARATSSYCPSVSPISNGIWGMSTVLISTRRFIMCGSNYLKIRRYYAMMTKKGNWKISHILIYFPLLIAGPYCYQERWVIGYPVPNGHHWKHTYKKY